MKKNIKIFFILMFILLVFGITTSKTLAVDVGKTTSQNTIVKALENNQSLIFGDSYNVYKYNPWVFCRQKGGYLRHFESTYTIEKTVVYPTDNQIESEPQKAKENRYAIAFVFSYGKKQGYEKDDIQAAYWKLLGYSPEGDTNGKNKYTFTTEAENLYNKGLAYQTFKKQEINLEENIGTKFDVIVEKNTEIKNNELIYGPIKIQYSYAGGFGGFDFQFSGENVTTSNVQLCKKNGNEYENIDQDNDGKIRTAAYSNGQELYIKVDLSTVDAGKVNLKIEYNTVDATATLYQIKGTHNQTGTTIIYCEQCVGKMDSATTSYSNATENQMVIFNNAYWVCEGTRSLTTVRYNTTNRLSFPIYIFGDNLNVTDYVERKWQLWILCNSQLEFKCLDWRW